MKIEKIISWLDKTLKVADFDDVSNNGLQLDRAIEQSEQSNNRTIPHEPDHVPMVAERRLHLLQPEVLRELRVVPECRMRVKRQMVGTYCNMSLNRRADDVPDATREALDATSPGNTVMDDQELRTGLRRLLDRPDARIDRERHRTNFMRGFNLQPVVGHVVEVGDLERPVEP